MDKQLVQVWNVNLKSGHQLRVATIEQGSRKPSLMCVGCQALCCHGRIRPVLNAQEFLEKKFPIEYIEPEEWLKERVPRAQWVAVLKFNQDGECLLWDKGELKCKAWPNPPSSCLAYDCRDDAREGMRDFANKREKEWQFVESVLLK